MSAAAAKLLQSCLTLSDPIDGSPPGSSMHGILGTSTGVGHLSALAFSVTGQKMNLLNCVLSLLQLLNSAVTAQKQQTKVDVHTEGCCCVSIKLYQQKCVRREVWPTAFVRQDGGGVEVGGDPGRLEEGGLWEGSLTVHLPLRNAQADAGEGV